MRIAQYVRNTAVPFSILMAVIVSPSNAGAAEQSPFYGGNGGNKAYNLNCGAKAAIIGLNGRFGLHIDQLGLICQKIRADGSLGEIFTKGPVGGTGGQSANARCKPKDVAGGVLVTNISLGPMAGPIIYIALKCQDWSFSSKARKTQGEYFVSLKGRTFEGSKKTNQRSFSCMDKHNVLRALKGKHGSVIDSLQAVCDRYDR